ncbi:MAG: preprotein translocase subunit SecA [Myxococcales bacterium]|nr:preprotein translocase subunit SecA [Myxococcales bacterium]
MSRGIDGAWRSALQPDARRLLEAYEAKSGPLPAAAHQALGAGGPVGVERLQAVLTDTCPPDAVAKALASVRLGAPALTHGGRAGFLDQVAELKRPPEPSPSIFARVFGTYNDRALARTATIVKAIGAKEPQAARASDAELKARADTFRARIADGTSLDDLVPEAFATVREVSRRVLGMRHYDSQVTAGVLLHQGKIAELGTGEGKTLAATLPVYLNALSGQGVHVITVNDYLAKRDAQWMGPVYHALGLTVGVLQSDGSAYVFDPTYHADDPRMANLRPVPRKEAYAAAITHGTNNEFGFDYLRDNIAGSLEEMVQRKPAFALIDEVDNVLIDEARTPMIISGPSHLDPSEECRLADAIVSKLTCADRNNGEVPLYELEVDHPGDYVVNEKDRTVTLTDAGLAWVEGLLGYRNLYDEPGMANRIHQALAAHAIFERDKDYIVDRGEVVIVDPHTGRPSTGRRWADGLHQAVEAKEGVEVKRENETLARVSVQNYFRRYPKLAGMTGTARTEASELGETYKLDVVSVPPNRPLARRAAADRVFATKAAKDEAVVADILTRHAEGRPVLVGTTSVEESEALSARLDALGVPHEVLNAKEHEREAEVVAQAGRSGAVTIATNMAGRGTDIKLGGDAGALAMARVRAGLVDKAGVDPAALAKTLADVTKKAAAGLLDVADPEAYAAALVVAEAETQADKAQVLARGGLHVIGTTRHESRRIDDQLLGRAGRQGDPGSSAFYVSLEDDLMLRFGSQTMGFIARLWGGRPTESIDSPRLTKAIGRAQERVEGLHAHSRKELLKYDDVLNAQRDVTYRDRLEALESSDADIRDALTGMIHAVAKRVVAESAKEKGDSAMNLSAALSDTLGLQLAPQVFRGLTSDEQVARVEQELTTVRARADRVMAELGPDLARRSVVTALDEEWRGHLELMDTLKKGIHWRGYAQKDPLIEYKRDAFELYTDLQERVQAKAVAYVIGPGLGMA